jgi:hypothetical protein
LDGEFAARESLRQLVEHEAFDNEEDIEACRATVVSAALEDEVARTAAMLLPEESVEVKQRLLEETDLLARSETLFKELQVLRDALEARRQRDDQWPRFGSMN